MNVSEDIIDGEKLALLASKEVPDLAESYRQYLIHLFKQLRSVQSAHRGKIYELTESSSRRIKVLENLKSAAKNLLRKGAHYGDVSSNDSGEKLKVDPAHVECLEHAKGVLKHQGFVLEPLITLESYRSDKKHCEYFSFIFKHVIASVSEKWEEEMAAFGNGKKAEKISQDVRDEAFELLMNDLK